MQAGIFATVSKVLLVKSVKIYLFLNMCQYNYLFVFLLDCFDLGGGGVWQGDRVGGGGGGEERPGGDCCREDQVEEGGEDGHL